MKSTSSPLPIRLKKIIPGPIKPVLRALGLGKLPYLSNKISTVELEYQKSLVGVVTNNQPELLAYWREYRFLDDVNAICKIRSDTRVLDVGCGICSVLHFIDGQKFGIDPLAGEYRRFYPFPQGIDVRQGYGEKIPFRDGYFDVVISSSALDHVVNPSKTIDEIRRVLKPGGYMVLYVDIVAENEVSDHSRYSLEKKDVYSLVADKFHTVLERESPRIPYKAYVNGLREGRYQELIMILKKV